MLEWFYNNSASTTSGWVSTTGIVIEIQAWNDFNTRSMKVLLCACFWFFLLYIDKKPCEKLLGLFCSCGSVTGELYALDTLLGWDIRNSVIVVWIGIMLWVGTCCYLKKIKCTILLLPHILHREGLSISIKSGPKSSLRRYRIQTSKGIWYFLGLLIEHL